MSNGEVAYQYEIGRMTGLPTASHMARFALTHDSMLGGIIDPNLRAVKESSQRLVPIIPLLNAGGLETAQETRTDSWDGVCDAFIEAYRGEVQAIHEEPLEPNTRIVRWLLSLDRIYPMDREWTNKARKAFGYGSTQGHARLARSSERQLSTTVVEAVNEGTRTTAAYLDVVACVAAIAADGDQEKALMDTDELVGNSAPFIIEFSGFGKRMNDTVISNVCANPQVFKDSRVKYSGLRFDPANFEIRDINSKIRPLRYVTFTNDARERIMNTYDNLHTSQKDPDQLFGCPAHIAAGVTRIYKTMAEIGLKNNLFIDAIDRVMGKNVSTEKVDK